MRRRQRFLDLLGDAAAVIPLRLWSPTTPIANAVPPEQRLLYLTGFDEPDAVALLLPHRAEGERYVLLCSPANRG